MSARHITFGLQVLATSLAFAAVAAPQAGWAQTVSTKQYEDGGVYEGSFLNGRQRRMVRGRNPRSGRGPLPRRVGL